MALMDAWRRILIIPGGIRAMLQLPRLRRLVAAVLTLVPIATVAGASQLFPRRTGHSPDEQATEQLPPADPYQAIPPFYLQDRFWHCEGHGGGPVALRDQPVEARGTRSAKWRLDLIRTGPIAVR
jgi:hypothetical protein